MYLILNLLLIGLFENISSSKNGIFNKFQQSDYKIKPERLELISYNKEFISYAEVVTYKYNRTWPLINATFEFKVDHNAVSVLVQVFKFLSNEFRVFPLRLEVNVCDALSHNLIGSSGMFHCGNFTGCPTTPNARYHICMWMIDQSMFPPFIPTGKFMLEFKGLLNGVEVALLRGYGQIDRPIA